LVTRVANIEHTVKFTLAATFHIDGVLLEIEDGWIMTISTGESRFEGKLTHGKLDLINRKSAKHVFPGERGLGEGIIISP